MRHQSILAVLAVLCGMAAHLPPARAQLDIFGTFANNLTPEDVAMMKETSASLYQDDDLALTTTKRWANAKSGNSGAVTLIKRYEYQGMQCRTIKHSITEKNQDHSSTLNFERCKTPSGEWMLR